MPTCFGTYDTETAKQISLQKIINLLNDFGAHKIYLKKLAPNDNSKNQPYMGSHLTDLSFLPSGDIIASETTSNKPSVRKNNKYRIKYQADLKMVWFDAEGKTFPAPNAKLIYYPQYPEVRLSGFLKGSSVDAGKWMDPTKQGRSQGRWLILGIKDDKTIYSYLVTPDCALSNELEVTKQLEINNVFTEINTGIDNFTSTKAILLSKLYEIHEKGWIKGQKLSTQNIITPYNARNAGGYTLEAELGITPNGIAEPDYLGWEIKQFNVKSFPSKGMKPVTLMTPEPDGGYYKENGGEQFVRQFGYPDKSGKPDRLNFGGVHKHQQLCTATNLTLNIYGFDFESSSIIDAAGSVRLVDNKEFVAASWSFAKLMNHWKRKHSQVAYVPCLSRFDKNGFREFYFGKDIEIGVSTDFNIFLSAMTKQKIYYDPGIKLENASTMKPKYKARNQFKIKHNYLNSLYQYFEIIDCDINVT